MDINAKLTLSPNTNPFGEYANAFRVVDDTGTDCLLDFIIFSKQDPENAQVVSRVRVRREFLPSIMATLSEVVTDFPTNTIH